MNRDRSRYPRGVPALLDTSRWPIVVTTLVGTFDETAAEAYLADFVARVLDRHSPFVSIVDTRGANMAPSAKVRRRVAEWEATYGDVGVKYNRCVVYVSDSAIMRGAMTALHWLSPPRVPTFTEATLEEAERRARAYVVDVA